MNKPLTAEAGEKKTELEFVPAIAVFHCRWCLPDSDSVRSLLNEEVAAKSVVIPLNCTARMEAEFAIKALSEGFDGILILGCEIGECHYRTGNHRALKRLLLLRDILALVGIYPERLGFFWVSPFDQENIRLTINEYLDKLQELGSFK